MKLLLFIVLLITNTICADDCTSLSTENTCKEKTGCKWTAATCTGDNSCTLKTASEAECKGTSYKEKVPCTYTPAVTKPAECTGDTVCTGVNNLDDNTACVATKFGGTACSYTPAAGDNAATCTGGTGTECTSVTPLTEENCQGTYYAQDTCSYTAASITTPASCSGDSGAVCSGVRDLSTASACQATTFEGTTTKNCVYAAGSCSADTTKEPGKSDTNGTTNNPGDSSNTEQDNSGYIKFSLLFSLLYLLF